MFFCRKPGSPILHFADFDSHHSWQRFSYAVFPHGSLSITGLWPWWPSHASDVGIGAVMRIILDA